MSLTGCATSVGKIATGVAVVSSVVAVSNFHLDLFCGPITTDDATYGSTCQSNTTSAVFAAIAGAAALTGLSFEIVHCATSTPRARNATTAP
jgi:hypothetical protein